MPHDHGLGEDLRSSPSRRRVLVAVILLIALATAVGLAASWPQGDVQRSDERLGLITEVYGAEVASIVRGPCAGTIAADDVPCARTRFRLTAGPDRGSIERIELPESPTSPDLEAGDSVVLSYDPKADPGFQYQYADRQRRPLLLWLTILFVLVVIALGRWRGATALIGLGASLIVLLVYVLPALVEGTSPVLVAVVGSAAIAYLALYFAHGLRLMTTVALLGTLAALALTVGLATLFTELAELTGFTSEEAILVLVGTQNLDLSGIVLAGMVLGALGALDDVTVTQASAVWELRLANPAMSRWELYRAGLRIGRDHVASTVNTLALAYAGAALPLLLLFVLAHQSLGTIANSEIVSTEIIRTLVGSIGLVAAVPLTTWLATEFVSQPRGRGREVRIPRRKTRIREAATDAVLPEAADRDETDFWTR
ncbi:MAG: YibE/F family protein [Acidimicrobiia bacterium]